MEYIIYQFEEDLVIFILNCFEVVNGFYIFMCEEILEVLILVDEDLVVYFVLINVNGKVFLVGGDLVEMKWVVDEDDILLLMKIVELVNIIFYKIK